jgi:heme exporter protein D
MRSYDFSTWQSLLTTLLGLAVVTLIMVGVRLIVMQTVQRRRERENRQINERLRTLIAAYKTLGGSFTGDLRVDPTHLRSLAARRLEDGDDATPGPPGGERRRRIRDAVEAALSDVILLGTADQVRLAVQAATELVAGRQVETGELVIALRNYIRQALDLEPLPPLEIPRQGPTRTAGSGGRGAPRGQAREGGRAGAGGQGGEAGPGGAGLGGIALGRRSDPDQ